MSLSSPKQITLSDIALELNVSKVTVSKALRDHSDISDIMKNKVELKAKELGYTPNYIARNLSSKKTGTLGLVIPKVEHHFFSRAIESIYTAAAKKNYEIIMMVSQENAEQERKHIQSLLSMRVDGLLISVTEKTSDFDIFKSIKKMAIPLVFFDRVVEDMGFNCIVSDDEKGAYELVKYAIKKGHTNIGHLGGYEKTNIGCSRFEGYKRALEEAHIMLNPKLIIRSGFSVSDGYAGFMDLYHNNLLPDMLFTVSYPVALGVYQAAKELDLSIPKDIDIISFGDSTYNKFLNPSISGVHLPAEEIAKKAVDIIDDQINNVLEIEERRIVMPVKLNIEQTCVQKVI